MLSCDSVSVSLPKSLLVNLSSEKSCKDLGSIVNLYDNYLEY